jgi:hypothetical protein
MMPLYGGPKQVRQNLANCKKMNCLRITGAMKTAPIAAIEVLFGLPPTTSAGGSRDESRILQTTLQ